MPVLRGLRAVLTGLGLLLPSLAIAQSSILGPTAYVGGAPVDSGASGHGIRGRAMRVHRQ